MAFLWRFEKNHRAGDDAHPIVSAGDLGLLHAAVMKACDGVDGVRDGVINDPRDCDFHVESLLCKPDEKAHCLSPEQVTAIRTDSDSNKVGFQRPLCVYPEVARYRGGDVKKRRQLPLRMTPGALLVAIRTAVE